MAALSNYEKSDCLCQRNELPFEEISHEIDNNILSIKVLKNIRQIEAVRGNGAGTTPSNSVRVNCADASGQICTEDCAKVHYMPNKPPPPKKPEEESFFLKSTKRINSDDLEHILEMEYKAPRNYSPLPQLEPSPPPIIEVTSTTEPKKNLKGKKNKKKKKK